MRKKISAIAIKGFALLVVHGTVYRAMALRLQRDSQGP